MKDRICGKCKYHRKDKETGEWVCACIDSDLCGIETEYDYGCAEYDE